MVRIVKTEFYKLKRYHILWAGVALMLLSVLRVPIIKIFQIDSSHRKILHFSLFGVGRKRNGVMAENGTALRDTLSRSLESKIRLRDTRPHKRTKIYYRLCTV